MKRHYRIITSIFLLTLLAICLPAIQAQSLNSNTTLAQGNPPLTAGMVAQLIDFFEWSLDGKFSDAQRQQFQRDRVAEWQNRQQTEIEANLKLLAVYGQLAAMTAEQRNALKPNIQAELLKAIHAQPNNSTAQILLAVSASGQ